MEENHRSRVFRLGRRRYPVAVTSARMEGVLIMSSDGMSLASAVRESLLLGRPGCQRLVKPQRRDVVFACGARANSIYLIEAGQVKLERSGTADSTLILGMRGPEEFVGEEAVLGAAGYPHSAIMLTSGVVWSIDVQTFAAICDERPELWRRLAQYNLAKRAEVERRIQRISQTDVRDRIIEQLREFASAMRTSDGEEATLPLSQQELASLVGATRETTSSTLNVLQRQGFVALGHRTVTVFPTAGTPAVSRDTVSAVGVSAGAS
jgi:CRP/FNR family transcriptional regulator, cyclic AMP receptor protein